MNKFPLVSPRVRLIARWSLLAVFCVAILNACANRGMMSPSGSGGSGGSDGGQAGSGGAGSGGDMGTGGGGTGGDMGTGGTPIDGNVDMMSMDVSDARDANNDHACPTAMFSFESGTSGARLGTMQAAAKSITSSTANHYCGTHALEISTTFSGTSGNTTKGEVFLDLLGGPQNLTGKTVIIHVAAVPEPMPTASLSLTLITSSGSIDLKPLIKPLTSDWQTASYPLAATDGGVMMVMSFDIQIFDTNGYNGKIYIDDIDIR